MQLYIWTVIYFTAWLIAIGLIGNTTSRRVGGIRFIRCGRVCVSVSVARRPVTN